MIESNLTYLVGIIEDKDCMVMWNDGYGKYVILREQVQKRDGELMVFLEDFMSKHIDLYNCDYNDFLFFNKILS
jgi:hypothetical protein